MLDTDGEGHFTRRFGGVDVTSINPAGTKSSIGAGVIPLVYGTGWVKAPVVRSVTEGGLVRLYAVLGHGPINGVLRAAVNQYEIPRKEPGRNMESSGWYSLISAGTRIGALDADASDALPVGPLGSIAYLRVSVPAAMLQSNSVYYVDALVEGLQLPRYDSAGGFLGESFTSNPAWVYLDLLRRSGWSLTDLDLGSFGETAAKCDQLIDVPAGDGQSLTITKRRCNLVLEEPRSINDVMRGLSLATGLYLRHSPDGRLGLGIEGSMASQHPTVPNGSNCETQLGGGYPAYEFGDGTDSTGGIARRANGQPSFRRWSNPSAESTNKVWAEYIDEFNSFRRSTLSLSEVDDILATGQELAYSLKALGLSNYAHAFLAARTFLRKSTQGNVFVEFETSVRAVNLHPGDLITITYPRFGLQRTPFRVLRLTVGLNSALIKVLAQVHSDGWYDDSTLTMQASEMSAHGANRLPRPILGTVQRDGGSDFSLEEQNFTAGDGTSGAVLVADFLHPNREVPSSSPAPRFTLESTHDVGGLLISGRTYYYGVCGIDLNGRRSPLSSIERIALPIGGALNAVRLVNLSAEPSIVAIGIYRGDDPLRMYLIQDNVPVASSFLDWGYAAQLVLPPDELYDHTNFYWREEVMGTTQANISSSNSIGNTALTLEPGGLIGRALRVVNGSGVGQERIITGNTSTAISVSPPWTVSPNGGSEFCVAESNWHLGCSSTTSPARFEVPNRQGVTLHVTGRSANLTNLESPAGLAPLTRHTLAGSEGGNVDVAPPPEPFFGLAPTGQGTISLVGLSFATLQNTHTVSSAQLTVYYWDELQSPSLTVLAAAAGSGVTAMEFTAPQLLEVGSFVQVGREVIKLEERVGAGNVFQVSRGRFDTEAGSYASGHQCFPLSTRLVVVPLQPTMFGASQASSFSHSTFIPDVRVVAASLFVRNSRGNSLVSSQAFTQTTAFGLRTLSGGQYSIQYSGFLAIQSDVAPPLIIESAHAVGDVFATVSEAPTGAPVELAVRVDGTLYCSLTIPAGATVSNVVNGLLLPPLQDGSIVSLDVVSVGTAVSDSPGKDLTVTIRL